MIGLNNLGEPGLKAPEATLERIKNGQFASIEEFIELLKEVGVTEFKEGKTGIDAATFLETFLKGLNEQVPMMLARIDEVESQEDLKKEKLKKKKVESEKAIQAKKEKVRLKKFDAVTRITTNLMKHSDLQKTLPHEHGIQQSALTLLKQHIEKTWSV